MKGKRIKISFERIFKNMEKMVKKVVKWNWGWITFLIIMGLLALGLYGLYGNLSKKQHINTPTEPIELVKEVHEPLFTQVYDAIYSIRLDHPDIVMAQAIEESGNFTSKLFKEGNNLMGMKLSSSRPSTAVGSIYGHARYEYWEQSLLDYALWQSSFARKLSRDEYFRLLDSIYAEGGGYSKRLKMIIQSHNL